MAKTIDDYMQEPYTRVLTPDPDSGGFSAEVLELPGCLEQGETPEEAYANLVGAMRSWIETELDAGHAIPAPLAHDDYSGKIALRVPRGMHRRAILFAQQQGVSLNQFLLSAIAEKLGALSATTKPEIHNLHLLGQRLVPPGAITGVGLGELNMEALRLSGWPAAATAGARTKEKEYA